jgi:hypothetical protein
MLRLKSSLTLDPFADFSRPGRSEEIDIQIMRSPTLRHISKGNMRKM